MSRPRFLIGLDLGTTNCALAYVDSRRPRAGVQIFPIAQLVAPAEIERLSLLPSFLYFPLPAELESGAMALPWNRTPGAVAGVLARDRGALAPNRQARSAKSWLAHPGVDRRAPLLPWTADPAERRLSPVDVSARYLAHIRDAWNTSIGTEEGARLEDQHLMLTVPASFDEEARELTVEAAQAAGLPRLTLLEEPLAAFYAWLASDEADGRKQETGGERGLTLVCDVGGGTTDFTLIRTTIDEGVRHFERIAVGEHLLLGGDNLDLAIAAHLEQKMGGEGVASARLSIVQRQALREQARAAKERLLGEDPPEKVTITLLGSGRAVVGGAATTTLTRDEVIEELMRFLPAVDPDVTPGRRDRRAGLRELALPYEPDPAITRHLAAFLAEAAALVARDDSSSAEPVPAHSAVVDERASASQEGQRFTAGSGETMAVSPGDSPVARLARPDAVLFNGGFFASATARDRTVDVLGAWFGAPPRVLDVAHPEAAVAIGAAHYARLRGSPSFARRHGLVRAGASRSYYIGVRASGETGDRVRAVCAVPRGTQEGTTFRLDHAFAATTNRPVSFPLWSSRTRTDTPGGVVATGDAEDLHEHAPLVTVFRFGRKSRQVEIPVRLSAAYTEVGTLEVWCESEVSDHRWRLQFELRGAERAPEDEGVVGDEESSEDEGGASHVLVSEEVLAQGEQMIRAVFGSQPPDAETGAEADTPLTLVSRLEAVFGYGKSAWPAAVNRRLADVLLAVAEGRRRSPTHEARWLNLFGFCVRPGFGAAGDPWRVGEARKIYAAGLAFPSEIQGQSEWLVLWQRVGGGFTAGQQRELGARIAADVGIGGRKGRRLHPQIERESWRLLASFERLDATTRIRIGDELVRRIRRDARNAALLWAIGRVGARVPLYGPLTSIVPPSATQRWLNALLELKVSSSELLSAIVDMARLTGDPMRDLSADARTAAEERLARDGAEAGLAAPLREVQPVSDIARVFGEALPEGLRLTSE